MANIDYASLIGKPFSDEGRGPDSFNCWGLVLAAYRLHGITLPDFSLSAGAVETVSLEFVTQVQCQSPKWQRIESPDGLCVVALAISPDHPGLVNHFGVHVGRGRFLHILTRTRSIIDRISRWGNQVKGIYKWIG